MITVSNQTCFAKVPSCWTSDTLSPAFYTCSPAFSMLLLLPQNLLDLTDLVLHFAGDLYGAFYSHILIFLEFALL